MRRERALHPSEWGGRLRLLCGLILLSITATAADKPETFNSHPVVLDAEGRLLPWHLPAERAYDHFLRQRWEFIKTRVPMSPGPPPRSNYPQYFFYDGFWDRNGKLEADEWMNDLGEKIPNWYESARLYYAYSGDASVMKLVQALIDYALEHGTTPASFAWPGFPYTTTNAGDIEFHGFTSAGRFEAHEVQLDHAADMALTHYRMYLFSGDRKYLDAAARVADVLAARVRAGNASQSPWPYRVVMDSGKVTAEYGANWTPAYELLRSLARAGVGDRAKYENAAAKVQRFLLDYPMKTGYWTDGHTDTKIDSNTYKSNLSASNMTLYLLDHPEFDTDWRKDIPRLIAWTETYFVFRTSPGEPATMWGANVVGEQDEFNFKMDYQTARYAAACARWSALSGDKGYREKAYRSLNWVTYTSSETGQCKESPLAPKPIADWWSDCYGECPRMFYQAFAGVPEWAPPRENHILYSTGIVRRVEYASRQVEYEVAGGEGVDHLRLAFRPGQVLVNGREVGGREGCTADCYAVRALGSDDWAVTLRRGRSGAVKILGEAAK